MVKVRIYLTARALAISVVAVNEKFCLVCGAKL